MNRKNSYSPHLAKLEELILGGAKSPTLYEGGMKGEALHYEPVIAVQLASCEADSSLAAHSHEEMEIMVVFKGEFVFEFPDKPEVVCGPGQSITIPPLQKHSCRSTAGSKAVGITIPAAKGYPNGSEKS